MAGRHTLSADREQRFDELVADYLDAIEAGQEERAEQLLLGHPDLADDVAAFLDGQEQIAHLTAPLRELVRPGSTADQGPERTIEAEPLFRQALAMREKLVADYPKVSPYQNLLADTHLKLGGLLKAAGKSASAAEHYRQGIGLQAKLVSESSADPADHSEVAAHQNDLALLCEEQGDWTEARQLLEQAIVHQQTALKPDPKNPTYRQHLHFHYGNLVRTLLQLGEHAEAARRIEEMRRAFAGDWHEDGSVAECLTRCVLLAEADANLSQDQRLLVVQAYTNRAKELVQDALRSDDLKAKNNVAWFLATAVNQRFRDPPQAVITAKEVVAKVPQVGLCWRVLGVAHYRAGAWQDAIAALEKSVELGKGGDSNDWFFLAMAHWQLGDKEKARKWYDQAVQWIVKNKPRDEHLPRFHTEAAALLGIKEQPGKEH